MPKAKQDKKIDQFIMETYYLAAKQNIKYTDLNGPFLKVSQICAIIQVGNTTNRRNLLCFLIVDTLYFTAICSLSVVIYLFLALKLLALTPLRMLASNSCGCLAFLCLRSFFIRSRFRWSLAYSTYRPQSSWHSWWRA